MNKEEYQTYLAGDHWRSLREWALQRAGHRCQVCACPTELHVHHNSYSNIGAEKPEDLVVLCCDCHKLHHGKMVNCTDSSINPHCAICKSLDVPVCKEKNIGCLPHAELALLGWLFTQWEAGDPTVGDMQKIINKCRPPTREMFKRLNPSEDIRKVVSEYFSEYVIEQVIGAIEGEGRKANRSGEATVVAPLEAVPEQPEIRNIKDLPSIDRAVLQCAIAETDLINEIVLDPKLNEALTVDSRLFIKRLGEAIFCGTLNDKKDRLKSLLVEFGTSWRAFYRRARLIRRDPTVNIDKLLAECRRTVHRMDLRQALSEIDEDISECSDADVRESLLQAKLRLGRELNAA